MDIKIIGSKFLEIEAKKNPEFSGKLELKTNIEINSVDKIEKAKDALKITYIFEINYGELGKIKIKGELFLTTDAKTIKKIIKDHEASEKGTEEQMIITNFIMHKATIKAIEIQEELRLPIHIKLPTISIKKE